MNHTLVLDAVSQILDILGSEEIIALVAHIIGDIDAHGSQRIQAVAATRLQVMIDPCQRVHHLQNGLVAAHILHIADGIRRVDIHIIGNLGLFGVTGRMKLVTGR